jgi:hypothetical protein
MIGKRQTETLIKLATLCASYNERKPDGESMVIEVSVGGYRNLGRNGRGHTVSACPVYIRADGGEDKDTYDYLTTCDDREIAIERAKDFARFTVTNGALKEHVRVRVHP